MVHKGDFSALMDGFPPPWLPCFSGRPLVLPKQLSSPRRTRLRGFGKKWGFRTWLMTCHGAPTATAHTSGAKMFVTHHCSFTVCTQVSVRHSPSMGRAQLEIGSKAAQQTQPQRMPQRKSHKMIPDEEKEKKGLWRGVVPPSQVPKFWPLSFTIVLDE